MSSPIPKPKSLLPTRSVMGRIKASHPRLQCILVPLDFSGKSRQALRYAVPIALKFNARIVLLHVVPDARSAPGAKAAAAPTPAARRHAAAKRLAETAATLLPPGLHGRNVVRTGAAAAGILDAAGQLNADLIVLTTRARSGLRRILHGSTAEKVMRHAPCPVLSIRRT